MIENIIANIQSIFTFLCVLSVLIVVHEWGHFITAKKSGVKVEVFALGFGPKIFSREHNGTNYCLCLIPLGGYVKMAGDERSECTGAAEEFYSQPVGRRALIILNGPVTNFILAYVSLFFVFMLGYPDLSTKVGTLMEGYPAETAGLQPDDKIIEVDHQPISSWAELQQGVKESSGERIQITFLRDDELHETEIVPRIEAVENIFGKKKESRLIGISPQEEIVFLKYGPGQAMVKASSKLWRITATTYKAIYYMITGSMSPKESMTGPVGIFFVVKAAAEVGFSYLLFILGVISASLAIFNLLPLIPLDGGHLFLLLIEKIRGRPLSEKADDVVMRVGFSMIIVLAVFVFYNDFSQLGWIDKVKQIIP